MSAERRSGVDCSRDTPALLCTTPQMKRTQDLNCARGRGHPQALLSTSGLLLQGGWGEFRGCAATTSSFFRDLVFAFFIFIF